MKTIAKILIILMLIVPAQIPAETFSEIDVEKLFAEKKALIKQAMQLTEKERAVFWPLYDDYEKIDINIFKKRSEHIRRYIHERKSLSDKKAESMMNEYLQIEAEALSSKRAMVKNFSNKLPSKRVYQYFVLEELLEAGFFSQIAENLPEIK
jgi:hypothetical protein